MLRIAVVLLAGVSLASAQLEPGAGKFLVARRNAPDPRFAETVILMVQHDESSSMGLVINRTSSIPLHRVFSELPKSRTDNVFHGGPVEPGGAVALVRTKQKIAGQLVFDDIYLVSDRKLLIKLLTEHKGPETARVYLGYSGWGPGQLARELKARVWHVMEANARAVFDPRPDAVWPRLMRQIEVRFALIMSPAGM
jgi:putative transcriptional regulator